MEIAILLLLLLQIFLGYYSHKLEMKRIQSRIDFLKKQSQDIEQTSLRVENIRENLRYQREMTERFLNLIKTPDKK